MGQLIHQGSVKDVYRLDDSHCEFEFSDRISVFDVPIPNEIPGKGESLCDTASFWFKMLDDLGIDHHFVERSGPRTIVVKSVRIIRDYDRIIDGQTNHLIPLEFIVRHYVAGMLYDRVKRGEIALSKLDLGDGADIPYGTKLSTPYFECATKLEAYDRFLPVKEAMAMARIDKARLRQIEEICLGIDAEIDNRLCGTNLLHVDGKKEFGYDREGRLMVIDVFGTADEDRFWDKQRYVNKGECIELSKEAVRQHYRQIGFKDELYAARKECKPEPPIPPLPDNLVTEIAAMYRGIAAQICRK
ncbi:MAG: phosphoribosylaminoimidazolesuccinocarboxamide synthase [Xenococcaceae cyanobacterium]